MGITALFTGLKFIRTNWKLFAIIGAVAVIIYSIYTWRGDIQQAAYDSFFADLRQQEMVLLQQEIDRLTQLNDLAEEKNKQFQEERDEAISNANDVKVIIRELEDGEVAPVLRKAIDLIP